MYKESPIGFSSNSVADDVVYYRALACLFSKDYIDCFCSMRLKKKK